MFCHLSDNVCLQLKYIAPVSLLPVRHCYEIPYALALGVIWATEQGREKGK